MTKLSYGNKTTSGGMLSVCYILSTTIPMCGGVIGRVKTPLVCCTRHNSPPRYKVWSNAPGKFFLDPILNGQTYLWFCVWFLHMVLGVMVFCPWYFVDLIKEHIFH